MSKQIVAVTGLNGEVGSFWLNSLNSGDYELIDLYHTRPTVHPVVKNNVQVDLLNPELISQLLDNFKFDFLVHLAGSTHIDRCEADRINGKEGVVWRANVTATQALAKYCQQQRVHLVYLSTECVFDGGQESYTETSAVRPLNWYGETKAAAEAAIKKSGAKASIIRAVIAYAPTAHQTLWQQLIDQLEREGQVLAATDRWMTPTYLPDLINGIETCLSKRNPGIFHIASPQVLTPFEFATKLAEQLGYGKQAVIPAPLSEIMGEERAQLRLVHACLKTDTTQKQLELQFKTIDQVLEAR